MSATTEGPALCEPRLSAVARQLLADHQANRPFEPIAASGVIRNLDEAYAVQTAYVRLQQVLCGSQAVGYKIGLTSRQMQLMCGIDSPVSGVITSDRVLRSPAVVDASRFGRLGLEFELAVRMGRDLRRGPDPFTLEDVAGAVDAVAVAIELVDDRRCEYDKLDVLSLVADNSWNAGVVYDEFRDRWPELAELEGIVLADGVEMGRGFGRDVLGHPFIPLTWLANQLAGAGAFLRAGDIVMTGSLIRTQFPLTSVRYQFEVAGLGRVSCQVNLQELPGSDGRST